MRRLLASLALAISLSGCVVIPADQPVPPGTNGTVIVLPPTQVIMSWPPQYIAPWPYYGYWSNPRGNPYACPFPYSCYRPRPGVPPPRHVPPGWVP